MSGTNKVQHNVHDLCVYAAGRLKAVGFEKVCVSRKTEAVYFCLPGRYGLLRVSAHRSRRNPIGMNNVVAKLTFHGNCFSGPAILSCSPEKIETMIAIAVGTYMLNSSVQPPSNYHGKRGTWEHLGALDHA